MRDVSAARVAGSPRTRGDRPYGSMPDDAPAMVPPHKWAVGTTFEWEFTFPMPTNPFYEPKPKTRKTGKAKATRNPARKAPNPETDAAKPKTSKKPKRVPLTPEERRERTRARAAEDRRNMKKSGLCSRIVQVGGVSTKSVIADVSE